MSLNLNIAPRAPRAVFIALFAFFAVLAATGAQADRGPLMPAPIPPAYKQECASCHIAYPPGLLAARSWQRMMGSLDAHYGSDASLDAATVAQLSQWLSAHAGTYKRTDQEAPQDRITRSAWFERKHRKVDAAIWRLPSIKSAANCTACHAKAEQGVFDDDQLRLPAGLSPAQQRTLRD